MKYSDHCEDEGEHRRKARRDAERGFPDRDYYNSFDDNPCSESYTEEYRRERRRLELKEEEREEERRMEICRLQRQEEERMEQEVYEQQNAESEQENCDQEKQP